MNSDAGAANRSKEYLLLYEKYINSTENIYGLTFRPRKPKNSDPANANQSDTTVINVKETEQQAQAPKVFAFSQMNTDEVIEVKQQPVQQDDYTQQESGVLECQYQISDICYKSNFISIF
ncbi:Hypothetical_protein [Hexamita inflata]|uniref:Hypothetical_protein n=1 Tax=Hexamita inflata TaxID=28002 RepID=A0AA86UFJ0_9EUKA|nr:Hypothetical protein HINF_LOCUS37471 [Hexamita inflata]